MKGLLHQVIDSKEEEEEVEKISEATEKNTNSYENLKYGSSVIINLISKESIAANKEKRLSIKFRTSDTVKPFEMAGDNYDINCLFRILPSSQHIMQDKILDVIEEEEIPENIEIDYENFVSEINSNTNSFNLNNELSVRFEDNIQLYHDSSKRFLCFYSEKLDEIKDTFDNQYSDSECFYLGFSEYPADNTHFSFETVPTYQQEEDGYIK